MTDIIWSSIVETSKILVATSIALLVVASLFYGTIYIIKFLYERCNAIVASVVMIAVVFITAVILNIILKVVGA